MKKKILLSCLLIVTLSGCTDTITSVSREYRNAINEGIDAMMMVTTESQAAAMKKRVFKGLGDRFKTLDEKLVRTVKANRTNKEFIEEFFESDSAHMYMAEIEINRQRFTMELTRLRTIMKQYVDRERELLIAGGAEDPVIAENEVSPVLYEMIEGSLLTQLRDQLKAPKIMEVVLQINIDKMKDYDKLYPVFVKKREAFTPKREKPLILIN